MKDFVFKKESLWFRFDNLHIGHLAQLNLHDLKTTVEKMASSMDERQFHIAEEVVKEILDRIGFMLDVGLGYLTLNRVTRSLSGGEAQRIRLATQIGSFYPESPIFWMNLPLGYINETTSD